MKKMVSKAVLLVTSLTLLIACSNNGTTIQSVDPVLNNSIESRQPSSEIMPLESSDIPSIPSSNIEQPSSEIAPSSSIDHQSSEVNERDHHISEELNFDEYYCESDDSYIRLYEHGSFQYDGVETYFANPYTTDGSLYITGRSYNIGDEENPLMKYDTIVFKIKDDAIVFDKKLCVFNSDFSLSDKSFPLKRRSVNENATYRYSRGSATKLLIDIQLVHTYYKQNIDEVLSDLGLSAYSNNVERFSNPTYDSSTYNGEINFSFNIYKINSYATISAFDAKKDNALIKSFSYRFNNYAIISQVNIATLGLNANNAVSSNSYNLLSKIETYQPTFNDIDENGPVCLTSLSEANKFLERLDRGVTGKEKGNVVELIQSLNEQTFIDYNFVFSNLLYCGASGTYFDFKNLYLKDNKLYIDSTKTIGGGYQWVHYEAFAILVAKSLSFEEIITISHSLF